MWLLIVLGTLVVIAIIVYVVAGLFSAGTSKDEFPKNATEIPHEERDAEEYGKAGENHVARQLENIVSIYGGHLFNNFCFEDEDGFSTEIDHILITRGGVFIIETKTYKGTIYGNKDDEYWECIKNEYQDNKSLKNPIQQNQGHINHLRRMFQSTPPKMISMIIFPVADISNIDSNIVYDVNGAVEAIEGRASQNRYSNRFVERVYNQFNDIKNKYGISKERHIQNLDKKYH